MLTAAQELAEMFRNVHKSDWNVNPCGYWSPEAMQQYLDRREAQIATNLDEGRRWDFGVGLDSYDAEDEAELYADQVHDADSMSFADWMEARAAAMGVET
jgi:hypothetical protein